MNVTIRGACRTLAAHAATLSSTCRREFSSTGKRLHIFLRTNYSARTTCSSPTLRQRTFTSHTMRHPIATRRVYTQSSRPTCQPQLQQQTLVPHTLVGNRLFSPELQRRLGLSSTSLSHRQFSTDTNNQSNQSESNSSANRKSFFRSFFEGLKRHRIVIGGIVVSAVSMVSGGVLFEKIKRYYHESKSQRVQQHHDILSLPPILTLENYFEIATKLGMDTSSGVSASKCFNMALEACRNGEWEKINAIKQYLRSLKNADGLTIVLQLVKDNDPCIKRLIDLYSEDESLFFHQTDNYGNNALHIAAIYGHTKLIDPLTNCFAPRDPNRDGNTPAMLAIQYGRLEVLRVFLKNGYLEKERQLFKLFVHAVTHQQLGCFEALLNGINPLQRKQKLEEVDMQGYNILHHVVLSSTPQMLESLLKSHYEELKGLIKKVSTVQHHRQITPLHLACEMGKIEMIPTLVQLGGSELEAKDANGFAPVHFAAINNHSKILILLWQLGANLRAGDNNDRTPLQLIQNRNDPLARQCVAVLEKFSAIDSKNLISPPDYINFPPLYLALKGGGPKCLAQIGAVKELYARNLLGNLLGVAGTSGGAILAAFLATGITPEKMEELLGKNFEEFFDWKDPTDRRGLDAIRNNSWWEGIKYIFNNGRSLLTPVARYQELCKKTIGAAGLCKGDKLLEWIEKIIAEATGISNCTFGELQKLARANPQKFKDLHVYTIDASQPTMNKILRLCASKKYKNVVISHAVAASARIPILYETKILYVKTADGQVVPRPELGRCIDGGVLKNLPYDAFDPNKYHHEAAIRGYYGSRINKRTLAISLSTEDESAAGVSQAGTPEVTARELFGIFSNAEDIQINEHPFNVSRRLQIPLHGLGVGLLDFNLTAAQKAALMEAGRKAVVDFLPPAAPIPTPAQPQPVVPAAPANGTAAQN